MAGYIGSGASVVSSGAENKKVFDITTNTTSLTGLNYTVGKVHVYHNGVRLVDGTDYTATNSTSITLTVAAVSGDQVVVVSYASFQLSEHYTKAETDALVPSSIDDNGNATAITITSDEEVLIGKTTDAQQTAGTTLYQNGQMYSTVNGSQSLVLTRKTNDGALALFYKDTNEAGRIGSISSDLVVGKSSACLRFDGDNEIIYPATTTANFDARVKLGSSSSRFKDLYLSGGVYLGGTGSANKLDDVETGTWTPSLNNAPSGISIVGTSIHNNYTKIGNFVFLTGYIELNTGSSSGNAILIGGLPFSPRSVNAVTGSLIVRYASSDTYAPFMGNSSQIELYKINNTGNWNLMTYSNVGNPFSMHFTISYQT